MRRFLLWAPLLVFALMFTLVASGLVRPAPREIRSAMVGKAMPRIALPAMLDGRPGIDGARFADGKVRIVNVFASWCAPCRAEAPQLMALKRAGVEIHGIAVRDTRADLRRFFTRFGDPYTAVGDDAESRAMLALGASGVPETYVVGGDGRIVAQHIGYIGAQDVAGILATVRREQARARQGGRESQ